MKKIMKYVYVAAVLFLAVSCQEKEMDENSVPVKPEVSFAIEEDSFETLVNTPVELKAEILTGGPVECSWSVDDEVIAATPTTKYIFREKGDYKVAFAAFNEAGRTEKTYTVTVVGDKLVVEFDKTEDFTIRETETVEINATVTAGDKDVVHQWTVTPDIGSVSETAGFSYTFSVSGDYTITYNGRNADDETFARTWKVTVLPKALDVEFSVGQGTVTRTQGEPLFIEVTALTGAAGLVHEWKVDGETVGSDALFGFVFSEAKTYAVTYSGHNGAGETAEGSWTVEVSGRNILFTENFEEYEDGLCPASGGSYVWLSNGHGFTTTNDNGKTAEGGWRSAVEVRTNPESDCLNGSTKILADDMFGSSSEGTSGVFNYRFPNYKEKARIKAVRMKIWMGKGNYYPWLVMSISGEPRSLPSKVNGVAYDPKGGSSEDFDALWVKETWNVVEYNLQTCFGAATLNGCDQIMPRPFMDFSGGNSSGRADPETNSRVSYFDDIEFIAD